MSSPTPTTDLDPAPVAFPRVVYGSSALGNLFQELSEERKLGLVAGWMATPARPVVIDSAGKYGAGLALECLGNSLRSLAVDPGAVRIGVKLGWRRTPLVGDEPTFEPGAWVGLKHDAELCINGAGVRVCWEQSLELLGDPYRPAMISVHDPDEYLAAARDDADRKQRHRDIAEAYAELDAIRATSPGMTVGVGTKDWRVAKEIEAGTRLDWVMLANCITAYTHDQGALACCSNLASRGIPIVNSGVFNAGFLVGGESFDYRRPSPVDDAAAFRWREAFLGLCRKYDIDPPHACIRFGLSPPGVVSVALNTTDPDRVAQNLRYASEPVPAPFWAAMRELGLVAEDYPYLEAC